jgi:hypothetical protein
MLLVMIGPGDLWFLKHSMLKGWRCRSVARLVDYGFGKGLGKDICTWLHVAITC